jgi:hypothetical protein
VGLATQRDLSVWILRTKLQIITVLFVVIKYMIDMTADFLVFFFRCTKERATLCMYCITATS